jgi:hypothetical protein
MRQNGEERRKKPGIWGREEGVPAAWVRKATQRRKEHGLMLGERVGAAMETLLPRGPKRTANTGPGDQELALR